MTSPVEMVPWVDGISGGMASRVGLHGTPSGWHHGMTSSVGCHLRWDGTPGGYGIVVWHPRCDGTPNGMASWYCIPSGMAPRVG